MTPAINVIIPKTITATRSAKRRKNFDVMMIENVKTEFKFQTFNGLWSTAGRC